MWDVWTILHSVFSASRFSTRASVSLKPLREPPPMHTPTCSHPFICWSLFNQLCAFPLYFFILYCNLDPSMMVFVSLFSHIEFNRCKCMTQHVCLTAVRKPFKVIHNSLIFYLLSNTFQMMLNHPKRKDHSPRQLNHLQLHHLQTNHQAISVLKLKPIHHQIMKMFDWSICYRFQFLLLFSQYSLP